MASLSRKNGSFILTFILGIAFNNKAAQASTLIPRACDIMGPQLSITPSHFEYIADWDETDYDVLRHGIKFTIDHQATADRGITRCLTEMDVTSVDLQNGTCYDSTDNTNWTPSGTFTYRHQTRELNLTISWQCEGDKTTILRGDVVLPSECCYWWGLNNGAWKCTLTEGIAFPTRTDHKSLVPRSLPPPPSPVTRRSLSEKPPSCAEMSVGTMGLTVPPGFWHTADDIGREFVDFNLYNPATRTCSYCRSGLNGECYGRTRAGIDGFDLSEVTDKGEYAFDFSTKKLQVNLTWTCDDRGNLDDNQKYTITVEASLPSPMICTTYKHTRLESPRVWPNGPVLPRTPFQPVEEDLQKRRWDTYCNTTLPTTLSGKGEAESS